MLQYLVYVILSSCTILLEMYICDRAIKEILKAKVLMKYRSTYSET